MTSGHQHVAVVGAGLVGLAVGRQLAHTGHDVTVFDKEPDVAMHQSGHNSGVVHSGIYYAPGSLKATLCRRGAEAIREFCAAHRLEYREIGKVVVARDELEVARLREIERRAHANGVPGVRWLHAGALHELEPNVRGVAALQSPTAAIVDFRAIARALADEITAAGGAIQLQTPVTAIDPVGEAATLHAGGETQRFDRVVLCAGLQSDALARAAGDEPGPAIVPFRGEYYRLRPERSGVVRGLVYPVPDPAYPFLGVHVTPRVDGTVEVGPNAVLATAREGYRRRDVNLRELRDILAWPGARRLIRRHWRAGLGELRGSLSKRTYLSLVRAYVPDLRRADLVRAPAGVRAQAVDVDGTLVDDFRISHLGPVTAVRNAPSPAATSCLAIAEHLAEHIVDRKP
jgi:L-2-hydroxyglutarate oxidase LhgO